MTQFHKTTDDTHGASCSNTHGIGESLPRQLSCLMKIVELEPGAPVASPRVRHARLPQARLNSGAFIAQRELRTITGQAVRVPDPERYVHLQFRRFAGCPICDLHLRSFTRRHDEIVHSRIKEVVVFHSPVSELVIHASDLPFAVIADPEKQYYAEFGVESSIRSLLDPRTWRAIVLGVLLRLYEMVLGRKSAPAFHITGGRLGLPADLLIASDGSVVASKYGVHANDHWSVDDLLRLTASQNGSSPTSKSGRRMKSPAQLHEELRRRILHLAGVTERRNAGIHDHAFLVGRMMFMHIHGHGHCDIRLANPDQQRVLAEGKARRHRWAPEKGYVTFVVKEEKDLEPAMELIRMSHEHFAGPRK